MFAGDVFSPSKGNSLQFTIMHALSCAGVQTPLPGEFSVSLTPERGVGLKVDAPSGNSSRLHPLMERVPFSCRVLSFFPILRSRGQYGRFFWLFAHGDDALIRHACSAFLGNEQHLVDDWCLLSVDLSSRICVDHQDSSATHRPLAPLAVRESLSGNRRRPIPFGLPTDPDMQDIKSNNLGRTNTAPHPLLPTSSLAIPSLDLVTMVQGMKNLVHSLLITRRTC